MANPDRLRVAFLIGSLRTGGAEGQLLELLRRIDRSLIDPLLILFRPETQKRSAGIVEEVYALGPDRRHVRLSSGLTKLPSFFLSAVHLLRRIKPDVFHAFLPESSTIVGCPAARLARVPVVLASRRSSALQYRGNGAISLAERVAMHACDFMLGNSRAVTEQISTLDGFPRERTSTIYNGVDTDRFRPGRDGALRARYGWGPEHFVVGIVANFRSCKRHDDFARTAVKISCSFRHARFLMCGEDRGSLDAVKQILNDSGIRERVRIVRSDRPDLDVYPALDAYLCTSDSEGFSNSVLEAMASGKPVVATDVGGNAEAVRDGSEGFITSQGDVSSMAACLARLMRDPQLNTSMALAGRQRAEVEFSMATMVKAHETIYLQLHSDARVGRRYAQSIRVGKSENREAQS